MNFRNLLLASLFLTVLAGTAKSQTTESKFYVKAYGGYGLLTPGSFRIHQSQTAPDPAAPTENIQLIEELSGVGKGIHYGGGIGYIINEFLNVGIDAEYLMGAKINGTSSYSYTNGYTYNSQSVQEVSSSVLSIIPNVTFKAVSKPSYYIYTRIGIVVAVDTKMDIITKDTTYTKYSTNTNIINEVESQKYEFNTSLGLQTSLGVQFRLTEKLRGFTELVGFFLPTNPTKLTTVVNSKSQNNAYPPVYTQYIHEYNFFKSGQTNTQTIPSTGSGTTPQDPKVYKSTSETVRSVTNFNYIGINAGVAFRF